MEPTHAHSATATGWRSAKGLMTRMGHNICRRDARSEEKGGMRKIRGPVYVVKPKMTGPGQSPLAIDISPGRDRAGAAGPIPSKTRIIG